MENTAVQNRIKKNPNLRLKHHFLRNLKNQLHKYFKIKNFCCVQVPGDKNRQYGKEDKRIGVSYECNLFFYLYFFYD